MATSAAPDAAKKAASASRGVVRRRPNPSGKGELRNHRVRLHLSRRRVLHQVEGGKRHLPFGDSNVGGEL
jgi:hypothetical protein